MIALASDCLLFETMDGESIPFSAEMISFELMGNSKHLLDADFVKQASKAVFHYFRNELGRQTVTVGEFAGALEKVLRSFGYRVQSAEDDVPAKPRSKDADLRKLGQESWRRRLLLSSRSSRAHRSFPERGVGLWDKFPTGPSPKRGDLGPEDDTGNRSHVGKGHSGPPPPTEAIEF